jgi:hypothetical protein
MNHSFVKNWHCRELAADGHDYTAAGSAEMGVIKIITFTLYSFPADIT